ncbi:cytochrome P450 [Paraphysoderma sedebokerense]|nr:cytochrome P450 [Paraphysoderma sedebokerense]
MTVFFYLPFQPIMILTQEPKNVEYILKTNFDNFIKGHIFYENQMPLLGHGIFNSDGDAWRVQRKVASHIFNVKNFREFMGVVFEEHIDTLCSILGDAADTGSIVDIHDLFFRLTLDSFCEIGFGTKLGALKSPQPIPFAAAFDRAQAIVDARFFSTKMLWFWSEIFTGKRREMQNCVKIMDDFAYRMIKERKKDPNLESHSDLLSRFLNLRDSDGQGYSDKELRDIVLNFIIAGRDTTAQALSWTVYLLCQNPQVVDKFLQEIDTVTPDGYPTYDEVKNLKYGYNIFSEALRLYPSVPKEMKLALNECVLPDGTRVGKGDMVLWSPYVMGRLEAIWGKDALDFKPERWEQGHPGQYKYPVFNGGPRVCLGQSMAYIEGVSCLTQITREFEFELTQERDEIRYAPALTLPMKNGLKVRVKRRTK